MSAAGHLDDAVRTVLAHVYDPCSVAAGRPLSVLDMGLVRHWRLDAHGVLHVSFCVTFPGCTLAPHFIAAAETELRTVDGVSSVVASVDTDHIWAPEQAPGLAPPPMRGEPQAWRHRAQAEKNASQEA